MAIVAVRSAGGAPLPFLKFPRGPAGRLRKSEPGGLPPPARRRAGFSAGHPPQRLKGSAPRAQPRFRRRAKGKCAKVAEKSCPRIRTMGEYLGWRQRIWGEKNDFFARNYSCLRCIRRTVEWRSPACPGALARPAGRQVPRPTAQGCGRRGHFPLAGRAENRFSARENLLKVLSNDFRPGCRRGAAPGASRRRGWHRASVPNPS